MEERVKLGGKSLVSDLLSGSVDIWVIVMLGVLKQRKNKFIPEALAIFRKYDKFEGRFRTDGAHVHKYLTCLLMINAGFSRSQICRMIGGGYSVWFIWAHRYGLIYPLDRNKNLKCEWFGLSHRGESLLREWLQLLSDWYGSVMEDHKQRNIYWPIDLSGRRKPESYYRWFDGEKKKDS